LDDEGCKSAMEKSVWVKKNRNAMCLRMTGLTAALFCAPLSLYFFSRRVVAVKRRLRASDATCDVKNTSIYSSTGSR
jgi:hypothetical protein